MRCAFSMASSLLEVQVIVSELGNGQKINPVESFFKHLTQSDIINFSVVHGSTTKPGLASDASNTKKSKYSLYRLYRVIIVIQDRPFLLTISNQIFLFLELLHLLFMLHHTIVLFSYE
jgi:hypothetical protein